MVRFKTVFILLIVAAIKTTRGTNPWSFNHPTFSLWNGLVWNQAGMKTQSGEIHDHSLLTILFASHAGKTSVRKCLDADHSHIWVPLSLLFFGSWNCRRKLQWANGCKLDYLLHFNLLDALSMVPSLSMVHFQLAWCLLYIAESFYGSIFFICLCTMSVETRDQCCLVLSSEQNLQSSFGLFLNFEGNYESNLF